MWRRPWWSWQWRDIAIAVICMTILVTFLYVVALGGALAIVAVMKHIRHALHHP